MAREAQHTAVRPVALLTKPLRSREKHTMKIRFILLTASLAVNSALTGCDHDTSMPTDATVQLAVVAGAEHGGRPFSTSMTQEETQTPVWAGDPDGSERLS